MKTPEAGKPIPKKEFPKTLTIGEHTFSVDVNPELKDFFETTCIVAAQTEKDKLYQSIEAKDKEIERISNELEKSNKQLVEFLRTSETNQNRLQELQQQVAQAAETASSNPMNAENFRKIAEEAARNAVSTFAQSLPNLFQEQVGDVRETLRRLEEAKVREHLTKRIAEEGDNIMPELVAGNTIEEIEASIVRSRELRAKYGVANTSTPPANVTVTTPVTTQLTPKEQAQQAAAQYQANYGNPITTPQVGQPQQVIVPVTPSFSTPEVPPVLNLKDMSDEDILKNKDALLKQVKSAADAYSASAGVGASRG